VRGPDLYNTYIVIPAMYLMKKVSIFRIKENRAILGSPCRNSMNYPCTNSKVKEHSLWAYSMPSVVMGHGPIQRSRSAAHPPAMGPFNAIGSGRAWAHTKVSLGSSMGPFNAIGSDGAWAHAKVSLGSYGPIQCHR
jgi:hypothetical protein